MIMGSYISAQSFPTRCYHKSLRYMLSIKDPVSGIARWCPRLEPCDVQGVHCPGRVNQVPDSLFRLLLPHTTSDDWHFLFDNDSSTFEGGIQVVKRQKGRQEGPSPPGGGYPYPSSVVKPCRSVRAEHHESKGNKKQRSIIVQQFNCSPWGRCGSYYSHWWLSGLSIATNATLF